MQTPFGHLTYCSNIHAGETWKDHFSKLQEHIPYIKEKVSPDASFGIGLRLSNVASLELCKEENLNAFKQWLDKNDCYVFTMNGFPYGSFHHTVVKDEVHAPDWTKADRVQYTIRLARILASLLPQGLDGGISTSPLSYRFWHNEDNVAEVYQTSTMNILQVVEQMANIKNTTGKLLHLDIEPEPDGLLGESCEFIDWYQQYLLPMGRNHLSQRLSISADEAEKVIKDHVQLCYDVCHFAICYEDHAAVLDQLKTLGIKTGKIQISAALKAGLPSGKEERELIVSSFERFNEPTYLHQVVARQKDGGLKRYADMPDAVADKENEAITEWRAHFHVPLFVENYGVLQSTQADIQKVLDLHKGASFTNHLEIETYTWEVLPEALRLPIEESIVRELQYVKNLLN